MSEARKEPAFGRAGDDSEQIRSHLDSGEDQKKRLRDELVELLSQEAETIDSDRLDALLSALEEIDPAPKAGAADTEESLKRFHQRHASLFSTVEEPSAEASPEKKPFRFAVFKSAVVAAALVVVLGTVAQAFGLNLLGAVARWNADVFRFRSKEVPYATVRFDPLEEGETACYDTLEEAVEAFGITAPVAPAWLPERFTLTGVTAENRAGGILIYADYECDDGYFQIRYTEKIELDLRGLEKEVNVELYSCSGIDHYLMLDMERWKAYWQNGELECRMSGSVSEQEIKDIIDSIYD